VATFNKFEDMEVWQKARKLCQEIYLITTRDNFYRDYRLREQIRGSSGSIMDNIAEGFDRGNTFEFIYFLGVAKGSAAEVRSQLYRALDRNHISNEEFILLYEEANNIGKMIKGQISYLNRTKIKGERYKDRRIKN
jgi:four helix bundle protein